MERVLPWEGMDHWANERRRIENHMGHCRSIDRRKLGTRERVPKLISLAEKCTLPPTRVFLVHGWDVIVKSELEKNEEISRPREIKWKSG